MTPQGFEQFIEHLRFLSRIQNGARPEMHDTLADMFQVVAGFVANTPPVEALPPPPITDLVSYEALAGTVWAPPELLVPPVIHTGAFIFATGDPETYKSYFCMGSSLAGVQGQLLWAPQQGITPVPTLYVSGEGGAPTDWPRAAGLIQGHGWPVAERPFWLWDATAVDLATPEGWAMLCARQALTGARLVVLDSLGALIQLPNENDNALVTRFVKSTILPFCRERQVSLVVIAHPPKLPAGAKVGLRESQTIRGAMAWRALADTVLEFRRDPRIAARFSVRVGKFRLAPRTVLPMLFEVTTTESGVVITYRGEERPGSETRTKNQQRIVAALESGQYLAPTSDELVQTTGLAKRTVETHCRALERDGAIRGERRHRQPTRWSLVTQESDASRQDEEEVPWEIPEE